MKKKSREYKEMKRNVIRVSNRKYKKYIYM